MSDQQRNIYQSDAERYEALISREDHQQNIPRALDEIINVEGLDVVDLGAGTGRLTVMLAPRAKSISAFDISDHMLDVTRSRLNAMGLNNWQVEVADHRSVPLADDSVDLVVSGWSVAYLAVWNPDSWRVELGKWLEEMKRILRPNSHIVLFESLGTGNESPIHLPHLESYYPWLDEMGFQNKWIRTDYQFETLDEAVELAGSFFGQEMTDQVRARGSIILPECTGVWWKKIE
ncbi:MAG: methyltransferase domain-containing protein [Anaerolineales bacterium]